MDLFYKSHEKLSYQNTAKIKLKFQTNVGLGFTIAIHLTEFLHNPLYRNICYRGISIV